VVLATDQGKPAAHGLWFAGRPSAGLRPWTDLVVSDPGVLPEVAAALGPGSSLMVAYHGDETEAALRRRVPPAATPLGLALLRAGCRWFKDWYYPEGGREGGTKLQGTLPLDDERRARAEEQLQRELRAFTKRSEVRDDDRKRAMWPRSSSISCHRPSDHSLMAGHIRQKFSFVTSAKARSA
jgi:hypothetical protein